MTQLQTLKLAASLIGLYVLYKLGLEVWCVVYGMMY